MSSLKRSLEENAQLLINFFAPKDSLPWETDLILVLGAHDALLAQEAAKVYKRYQERKQQIGILVTGGMGKFLKNPPDTEANFLKNNIIKEGIPEQKILVEDKKSTNTEENLLFARQVLFQKKGIEMGKLKSIILMATSLRQKRSWATFCKHFPNVQCINYPPPVFDLSQFEEIWFNTILVYIVEEMEKILAYPAKNFMIKVETPEEVLDAYQQIKDYLVSNPALPVLAPEEIFLLTMSFAEKRDRVVH